MLSPDPVPGLVFTNPVPPLSQNQNFWSILAQKIENFRKNIKILKGPKSAGTNHSKSRPVPGRASSPVSSSFGPVPVPGLHVPLPSLLPGHPRRRVVACFVRDSILLVFLFVSKN